MELPGHEFIARNTFPFAANGEQTEGVKIVKGEQARILLTDIANRTYTVLNLSRSRRGGASFTFEICEDEMLKLL